MIEELKRVAGKNGLLFRLAEAALEHPDGVPKTSCGASLARTCSTQQYRALSELGKVCKTIFLCRYLGSLELRHEIQEALNVIEHWNN